jgi:tetrahydromethanopterin S-methyltransferase subunit G
MTETNGGNGDKLVMKRDIEELGEKIDKLDKRFDGLELFFAPGGLCERARRKVDGHGIHILIQYGLLVVILVAVVWKS